MNILAGGFRGVEKPYEVVV